MDTIAGISTALSNGGISIIRISGKDAIETVDRVYKGKISLIKAESHTVNYGHIKFESSANLQIPLDEGRHDSYAEKNGEEIIDEVLVLVFRAPRSYTKEDMVEIHCHGGIVVTRKILKLVISEGARLAEPGEFTKRAFLNGRIDLSQAESVMDIIQSKSDCELRASMGRLQGKLSYKIKNIRYDLMDDIARIEAALDDPEHYDISDYRDEIRGHAVNYKNEIEALLKNAGNGKIFKEGIKTVILGKPNVGKSSLLNCLMDYERAIVTDIAGTTRDTLEETINLNDMVLNIIDTAGIRKTDDVIEKMGVERSLDEALGADLILYMTEAYKEMDDEEFKTICKLKDKRIIFIRNKCDLYPEGVKGEDVRESLCKKLYGADGERFSYIEMSIKKEKGIDELKNEIHRLFYEGKLDFNEEIYISSVRQETELKEAENALIRALESFDSDMPEDFITIDLMETYKRLGKIIGEEVEDDMVNRIFSKFCMGK